MNQFIQGIQLWCQTNGHDKLYYVWVEKTPSGQFLTESAWGARRRAISKQNKYKGSSELVAMQTLRNLSNAKQSKQYKEYPADFNPNTGKTEPAGGHLPWAELLGADPLDFDTADVEPMDEGDDAYNTAQAQRDEKERKKIEAARKLAEAQAEIDRKAAIEAAAAKKKELGIQTAEVGDKDRLVALIADDTRWAIPCTGDLVVVNVDFGSIVSRDENAVEIELPAALKRSLSTAPSGMVEGFLHGAELTVTDIFTFNDMSVRDSIYAERLTTLEQWYEMIDDSNGIALVEPATDNESKQALSGPVEFRRADNADPDKVLCTI